MLEPNEESFMTITEAPTIHKKIQSMSMLTFTLNLFQLGTQFINQFFYSTLLKERKKNLVILYFS
jgi:hypothetical protein